MLDASPISATLPASDMARARVFYEEVLGLEVVHEVSETGELVFECGVTLLFVYPSRLAGTNQATAAAWRVDDLDSAVASLRERGVVFEEYDFEDLRTHDSIATMPDGTRVAWFKDPDGNILGIDQMPAAQGLTL